MVPCEMQEKQGQGPSRNAEVLHKTIIIAIRLISSSAPLIRVIGQWKLDRTSRTNPGSLTFFLSPPPRATPRRARGEGGAVMSVLVALPVHLVRQLVE